MTRSHKDTLRVTQDRDLGSFIHELSEISDRLSDLTLHGPFPVRDVAALTWEATRLWNIIRALPAERTAA